jgi:hypothetical protein
MSAMASILDGGPAPAHTQAQAGPAAAEPAGGVPAHAPADGYSYPSANRNKRGPVACKRCRRAKAKVCTPSSALCAALACVADAPAAAAAASASMPARPRAVRYSSLLHARR